MKERRKKRAKFDPDQFKREFIGSTNQDEEITEYYKRGNSLIDRDVNEVHYGRNINNID